MKNYKCSSMTWKGGKKTNLRSCQRNVCIRNLVPNSLDCKMQRIMSANILVSLQFVCNE